MKLAIASGKGGTGKTTVAVNLAVTLANRGLPVQLLDLDVEAPNAALFLNPRIEHTHASGIRVPVVDEQLCDGCRRCAEACRFHALAVLHKPLLFPELCHGCGACGLVCPRGAIRETTRPIGCIRSGRAGAVDFVEGRLNIGEPMAPPLIRAVRKEAVRNGTVILDAPPGAACAAVAAVRDTDLVLLVTEPTPFGLHDLRIAVTMVRELGRRHGVVVNRADAGDRRIHDYCAAEGIPIYLELADDRRAAEAYARGELAVRVLPEWRRAFDTLRERLETV